MVTDPNSTPCKMNPFSRTNFKVPKIWKQWCDSIIVMDSEFSNKEKNRSQFQFHSFNCLCIKLFHWFGKKRMSGNPEKYIPNNTESGKYLLCWKEFYSYYIILPLFLIFFFFAELSNSQPRQNTNYGFLLGSLLYYNQKNFTNLNL